MNWKSGLKVGLILISAQISVAMAGVEPSPFLPEINQLGAVANILDSAEFRIVKTMSAPPEVCVPPDPCKGLNGDVNRLEAINNQVSSAQYMIESMIYEVMGVEPSPFRGDLIAPLNVVGDVAQGIVDGIGEKIGEYALSGNVPDDFIFALESVANSTIDLVEAVQDGVMLLSESPECADILDEEYCVDSGCYWISPPLGGDYFCSAVGY